MSREFVHVNDAPPQRRLAAKRQAQAAGNATTTRSGEDSASALLIDLPSRECGTSRLRLAHSARSLLPGSVINRIRIHFLNYYNRKAKKSHAK